MKFTFTLFAYFLKELKIIGNLAYILCLLNDKLLTLNFKFYNILKENYG